MEFPIFTGYLKAVDTHLVGARVYMTMAIPNMEVRYIYEKYHYGMVQKKSHET